MFGRKKKLEAISSNNNPTVNHVRWEYHTTFVRNLETKDAKDYLNKFGYEGWELVSSFYFRDQVGHQEPGFKLIFKRPLL